MLTGTVDVRHGTIDVGVERMALKDRRLSIGFEKYMKRQNVILKASDLQFTIVNPPAANFVGRTGGSLALNW